MKRLLAMCLIIAGGCFPIDLSAQVGRETGFDIPRFVTIRASRANIRRGPSTDQKVDWIFERPGLPVVVRGEFGHWRLIEDIDGDGGWIHKALISGEAKGLVVSDEAKVFSAPTEEADLVGVAMKGVIFSVEECGRAWCRVSRRDLGGWTKKSDLWGVDPVQITK